MAPPGKEEVQDSKVLSLSNGCDSADHQMSLPEHPAKDQHIQQQSDWFNLIASQIGPKWRQLFGADRLPKPAMIVEGYSSRSVYIP